MEWQVLWICSLSLRRSLPRALPPATLATVLPFCSPAHFLSSCLLLPARTAGSEKASPAREGRVGGGAVSLEQ